MIPIASATVVATRHSKFGALYYSAVCVLDMAITYGAIGALAGSFSTPLNVQAQIQNPILLPISVILFIALALAMCGVLRILLTVIMVKPLTGKR